MALSRRRWLQLAAGCSVPVEALRAAAAAGALREFTMELPEILNSYRFRAGVVELAGIQPTVARFHLPHPIARLVPAGDVRVELDGNAATCLPSENAEGLVVEARRPDGGSLINASRLRIRLYVLRSTRFDQEWTLTQGDSETLRARWGKTAAGLPISIRLEAPQAKPQLAAGAKQMQVRIRGAVAPANAVSTLNIAGVDAPVDPTLRTLQFDVNPVYQRGAGGLVIEASGDSAGAVVVLPVDEL